MSSPINLNTFVIQKYFSGQTATLLSQDIPYTAGHHE